MIVISKPEIESDHIASSKKVFQFLRLMYVQLTQSLVVNILLQSVSQVHQKIQLR
jgi:hypothetical protein